MTARGRRMAAALIAVLALAGAGPVAGQDRVREAAPQARELIAVGVSALELGDWQLALQQFRLAQLITPASPQLFLLLGLASEGVGGQDVAAIAWFRAYLAAMPTAPRAAEIRDRIARLEQRVEVVARELLADAGDLFQIAGVDDTDLILKLVAAHAAAGNLDEARKTAERLAEGPERAKGRRHLAKGMAARGDIAAALRLAQDIADGEQRDEALLDLIEAQVRRDDVVGARATARGLRVPDNVPIAAVILVTAHEKRRDRKGLQETLAQTPQAARRWDFWQAVASAHAELGDIAAARQAAMRIEDAPTRDTSLNGIAIVQAQRGDDEGARQTIGAIRDPSSRVSTWMDVIEARADRGDVAGARRLFATYAPLVPPDRGYLRARTLAAIGDVAAAVELADRLGSARENALGHIVAAAVRKGDVAALRPLARAITQPMEQRDAVVPIATVLVRAGDVKGAFAALGEIADPALRRDAEEGLRMRPRPPAERPRAGSADEEVRAWVAFIDRLYAGALGALHMADLGAHADVTRALRRIDVKDPHAAARGLVRAAEELLRALRDLRELRGRA